MRTRRTRRRTRRRDEDKIIRRTRMRISRKKKVAGKAVWYCSTVLVLCEPLQKLKNGKLTIYLFSFYNSILKFHKILRDYFLQAGTVERVKVTVSQ